MPTATWTPEQWQVLDAQVATNDGYEQWLPATLLVGIEPGVSIADALEDRRAVNGNDWEDNFAPDQKAVDFKQLVLIILTGTKKVNKSIRALP
ncbi:MAG: hypothetical protein R3C44_09760 [Chloroflexota bacterium]